MLANIPIWPITSSYCIRSPPFRESYIILAAWQRAEDWGAHLNAGGATTLVRKPFSNVSWLCLYYIHLIHISTMGICKEIQYFHQESGLCSTDYVRMLNGYRYRAITVKCLQFWIICNKSQQVIMEPISNFTAYTKMWAGWNIFFSGTEITYITSSCCVADIYQIMTLTIAFICCFYGKIYDFNEILYSWNKTWWLHPA